MVRGFGVSIGNTSFFISLSTLIAAPTCCNSMPCQVVMLLLGNGAAKIWLKRCLIQISFYTSFFRSHMWIYKILLNNYTLCKINYIVCKLSYIKIDLEKISVDRPTPDSSCCVVGQIYTPEPGLFFFFGVFLVLASLYSFGGLINLWSFIRFFLKKIKDEWDLKN